MRFHILSDLHQEFHANQHSFKWEEPTTPYDAVLCAGDVHHTIPFSLNYLSSRKIDKHIYFVPGNHEYYRSDMAGAYTTPPNVTMLRRGVVKLAQNVTLIGATLWTDYKLPYKDNYKPALSRARAMHDAAMGMTDHRVIKKDNVLFTPAHAEEEHKRDKAFIKKAVAAAKKRGDKVVVMTHHGCSGLSISPAYKGDSLNACFASDVHATLYGADLWVHGHVHHFLDYQLAKTRVVANPYGYFQKEETADFARKFVVEI